ncbi:MAG: transpeptidase family protein [Alistipes sp.]|nr:transpeptidase family protein [Alistipes sp.]
MEKKPKVIKSDIMSRVLQLYAAAIIMGIVVAVRLIYIQFVSPEVSRNADKLDKRIYRTAVLRANRGSILARTGEPLATSIFRSTIEFDFGAEGFDSLELFAADADSLSKLLAAHFGDRSARDYYDEFMRHRKSNNVATVTTRQVPNSRGLKRMWKALMNEPLEKSVRDVQHRRIHKGVKMFRDIDNNEWEMMRSWPILGSRAVTYTRTEHNDRIYPCGTIARSVVGRADANNPMTGLEKAFNDVLKGEDGVEWQQHIAYSFWTRIDKPASARRDTTARGRIDNRDAVDGTDVVTTIDIDIQEFVDRTLRERVAGQNAIWGTTMVMDVATGDLLAVSNITNEGGILRENYNHGFLKRTEPGSTFKLASMMALLEDAKMPVTKTYDAHNGKRMEIWTSAKNRVSVTDSGDDGGIIDMTTALARSSNTYFAQAVYETYREDPKPYIEFLRRLHLDRKVCTGMEALAPDFEAAPNFQHPESGHWTRHVSLIKMSFGQGGIEVTPLQILTLYNAVANNGRMVAPRLVRELRRDGKTVKTFPVEVLEERICSSSTLATVRDALEEAALTGTGAELFGEGKVPFRAALKTGTAEYAQGRIKYTDGYFVSSMATYFPADNPRYTIITTIHTHRSRGLRSGAKLAGPVNRDVAKFIYARDYDSGRVSDNSEGSFYPASIKGGSVAQIKRVAKELSPRWQSEGRDVWGRVMVDDERHTVIIEGLSDDDLSVMPDVTGMGLKDALFLLEERGLRVEFSGSGAVRSQSIRPGTAIQRGASVKIVLR